MSSLEAVFTQSRLSQSDFLQAWYAPSVTMSTCTLWRPWTIHLTWAWFLPHKKEFYWYTADTEYKSRAICCFCSCSGNAKEGQNLSCQFTNEFTWQISSGRGIFDCRRVLFRMTYTLLMFEMPCRVRRDWEKFQPEVTTLTLLRCSLNYNTHTHTHTFLILLYGYI